MNEYRWRWLFTVLALVTTAAGWLYFALDDTPSAWGLILTIATGGVFALLARE